MDVPAPAAGTVKELKVKVGDKVSEGSVILLLDVGRSGAGRGAGAAPKTAVSAPPSPTSAPGGVAEVRVPDIGDFKDVPVIEILVKAGDTVKAEDALVTLESDKATMDVPAPLRRHGAGHRGQGRRQGVGGCGGADARDRQRRRLRRRGAPAPAAAAAAAARCGTRGETRRCPCGDQRRRRRSRRSGSPTPVPACASWRANWASISAR